MYVTARKSPVTADTLTREQIADLMAIADVRVATDCQALLAGRGGKAKLGLIRERVASAYNRLYSQMFDSVLAERDK